MNFTVLDNIFNNINKWLEFAERKNAFVFSFFSLIAFLPHSLEK